MNTWFTADTHFGHKNVIAFCNRPYKSVEEMDNALIDNWNEVVGEHDEVYHLGDFSFMSRLRTESIVQRLNGQKTLVMGNHDKGTVGSYLSMGFAHVHKLQNGESLEYGSGEFRMSHYPFQDALCDYDHRDYLTVRAPSRDETSVPLVHGHVHDTWAIRPSMVNVGCDVWHFKPVSLGTVLKGVNHAATLKGVYR